MDQININRGQQQPAPAPSMNQPMQNQHMNRPRSRMPWVILTLLVIIVLAVLGFLFRDKLGGAKTTAKLSGYQAVFLTNGQVYFGKLSDVDGAYITLRDIYYLQVNQQLQPGGDQTPAQQEAAAAQQPQLSLVKLGNELHGPVDEMKINRQQVLFYEDLKADGKVAEAIVSYQKNGATQPAAQQPATKTPTVPNTPNQ